MAKYILCTDMDRTLLPNGEQKESPSARPLLKRLLDSHDISLIYVTGRNLELLKQGIKDYKLPTPDYAITDVGSEIYRFDGHWHSILDWQVHYSEAWSSLTSIDIEQRLPAFEKLERQICSKQGPFKLSFQVTPSAELPSEYEMLKKHLDKLPIRYQAIASVDETTDEGLIDVLPEGVSKLGAIAWLSKYLKLDNEYMMFSGDSGNDIDVLVSGLKSTLVNNATVTVKASVAMAKRSYSRLYEAKGLGDKLNGNYSAGILEGFWHYFPETRIDI